jgi:hypothetical protein
MASVPMARVCHVIGRWLPQWAVLVSCVAKSAGLCRTVALGSIAKMTNMSYRWKKRKRKRSAHASTPCLIVHAGPPCLAVHAYSHALPPSRPSPPYPLPRARRPDEPRKTAGEVWVVGNGGKKSLTVLDAILTAKAKEKEW